MSKLKFENNASLNGIDSCRSGKSNTQKPTSLLSLRKSPLSLSEFKILDAYLARIDPEHPERRWVRFSKNDLEELLGIQKINIADLKKHVEHLGIMINVEDLDDAGGVHSIALFEEAVCKREHNGLWQIDLKCTTGAMKYVFNLEDIKYLRYKLRSVIHLGSRYSYLMFLYLEENRPLGEWTVSLNDLKNFLDCTDPTYLEFKYFNRTILKHCEKELNEKTLCRFTYELVKRGRNVCAIRFVMDPNLPDIVDANAPNSFENVPPLPEQQPLPVSSQHESSESVRHFVLDACTPEDAARPEFSEEEQIQIMAVLPRIPLSKMPVVDMGEPISNDMHFRWYHYLAKKYATLNLIASTRRINNRFAYFLKMLEIDVS